MPRYTGWSQLTGYEYDLINRQANGWKGPFKLLSHLNEMMVNQAGKDITIGYTLPLDIKVSSVHLLNYYNSGEVGDKIQLYANRQSVDYIMPNRGLYTSATSSTSYKDLPAVSDLPTATDWAVNVTYSKVSDFKGQKYVTKPVPICGWDSYDVSFTGIGGNLTLPTYWQGNDVCVSADVGGSVADDNLNFTLSHTNNYDDWIVVTNCQLYGRPMGSQEARTRYQQPANMARIPMAPGAVIQLSEMGGNQAIPHQYTGNGLSLKSVKYQPRTYEKNIFYHMHMPYLGVPLDVNMSFSNPSYPGGSNYKGVVYQRNPIINSDANMNGLQYNCNAPWIAGFYNRVDWYGNVGGSTKGMWRWNNPFTNQTMEGCAVVNNISTDYLLETYGAQELLFLNYTNAVLSGSTLNGQFSNMVAAKSFTSINDGTSVYISAHAFGLSTGMSRLAFPNEEALIAFFNDWGMVCAFDEDGAKYDDNTTGEGASDVPEDGDFGPWDPNYPGKNPWDNTGGGGVPYNPNNPGTNPSLGSGLATVTSASGSSTYVLNQTELNKVTDWLMGDVFWKDASNLFVDKMSAINSLTLFPFDLRTHDALHTDPQTGIRIANVASPGVDAYVIRAGYNTWIDGGTLTFGDDWSALRPDFNAFSTSSYTIFIPFVGNVSIPASAAVYRKLKLDYALDIVNGSGTAVLRSYAINGKYGQIDNGFIVGLYPCQIGQSVPLVSSNTTQRSWAIVTGGISGAINGAKGSFETTAGKNLTSGAESFKNYASEAGQVGSNGFVNVKAASSGQIAGGVAGGLAAGATLALAGAAIGGAKGVVESAIANPSEFYHFGSIGSMASWALGFQAYLTVTSQIPSTPNGYEWLMGRQTSYRAKLNQFAYNNLNYVECSAVKLNIPNATLGEIESISAALERGVFI